MAKDNPSAAEVQKFLSGVDYPASKEEITEHAKENGADERVMDFLERIPDQEYNQPTDISHQLSEYTNDSGEK